MDIKDKVVLVTGGNGLLGKAFCTLIAEEGGIPIIADINPVGTKFAEELKNRGLKADFYKLNINSIESAINCIEYLHSKYGKIDCIVNNAYPRNTNYGRKFEDVEYSDFCENINLNIGGYFLICQQFGKYFCKQGYGNIVNIASIYGVIAPKFELYENTNMTVPVEYVAIKSAVVHLSKYIAKYYKNKNIRVNVISPGGILDNQAPSFIEKYNNNCLSNGMLLPKDVAGTLLYLLSNASNFVNGQNIIVDDGFTL